MNCSHIIKSKQNPCKDCNGKCCVGDIEIIPSDSIYKNDNLTISIPNKKHERFMRVSEDNQCICLIDGICSIYDNRPEICRKFTYGSKCCFDFQSGTKTNHFCTDCELYK